MAALRPHSHACLACSYRMPGGAGLQQQCPPEPRSLRKELEALREPGVSGLGKSKKMAAQGTLRVCAGVSLC